MVGWKAGRMRFGMSGERWSETTGTGETLLLERTEIDSQIL